MAVNAPTRLSIQSMTSVASGSAGIVTEDVAQQPREDRRRDFDARGNLLTCSTSPDSVSEVSEWKGGYSQDAEILQFHTARISFVETVPHGTSLADRSVQDAVPEPRKNKPVPEKDESFLLLTLRLFWWLVRRLSSIALLRLKGGYGRLAAWIEKRLARKRSASR